jgi:hypothetical protein
MEKDLGELTFREQQHLSEQPEELVRCLQRAGVLFSRKECLCGNAMSLQARGERHKGITWRCTRKSCKKRASIQTGTYFEKGRLPLGKMWMMIVCLLKFPKMLSTYLSEILEVSENTIVDWGAFLRETISHYYLVNPQVLGNTQAVQIDESLFGGKRKYHRGNHQRHIKPWVFGIVEESTNRCVLWAVKKRNKTTLTQIINEHVHHGSKIKSDEWAAYNSLGESGFNHLTVNHSVSFISEFGIHTQLIESLWAQVKSSLKLKRGTSKKHLAGYLDLYSFLCDAKHQKKTPLSLFIELIQAGNCY